SLPGWMQRGPGTASTMSDRALDVLRGEWLGHPLHPALTDLPIGFWTSAFVLDLVGGRGNRGAADFLVAAGLLSVPPTAAAGVADWTQLSGDDRQIGLVHAASNTTATLLYLASFVARRRGRRARGVLLGLAGATAATVGGYLGGYLVYRRGVGVEDAGQELPTTGLRGAVSG
ncbi:MAG: DUF2231 domain-containing protein, partial [Acidimicrobiales bacterium]